MIAFCNKRGNLTVVLGRAVYEFHAKSAEQAQSMACRVSTDSLFSDLLRLSCKGSPVLADGKNGK
jgi:hypothetical protein